MARQLFLILGIAVLGVNCDDLLKRIVRSSECDYCQKYWSSVEHPPPPHPPPPPPPGLPPPPPPTLIYHHPPAPLYHHPPPPPPPSYHARQWTALATSPDGTPHGVYSGATASFNGPARSTGRAYSVASSVDNCEDNGSGHADHDHEAAKHTNNENDNINSGHNKVGESYKQINRVNSEAHTSEEHQRNYPPSILRGDISDHEQAEKHTDTYENIHSNDKHDYISQTSDSNHDTGYKSNERSTNYDKEDGNKVNAQHQATVNGALNLAAQGLEAAEQKSKECSTCGRNNYAASNASSNSGDAVAISIGG